MKVEREFAGFALLFTAGIVSSVLTARLFLPYSYPLAISSMFLTSIWLVILMLPGRKHFGEVLTLLLTAAVATSSGMMCGFVSDIASCGKAYTMPLSGFGDAMAEAIDSIPFKSPHVNAIIKALITGDRHDIPEWISEAFRVSGASHILALSGLHLGIIYGIVSGILGFIGKSPLCVMIRSVLIVSLCCAYTLSTGAGPSITRAFLFILLGEAAKLTKRTHDTGTLLFAALFIQLCLSPQSCMSAGFQLSYAAMAGIAFVFPWLKNLWPRGSKEKGPDGPVRWIWNSATLSISCQMTTGPLAYLYFGSFPKHFLLTNILALPLTGIIIPVSLATLCLHTMGVCPTILVQTTEFLITLLTETLSIIATM